jgi:hypothetical protein
MIQCEVRAIARRAAARWVPRVGEKLAASREADWLLGPACRRTNVVEGGPRGWHSVWADLIVRRPIRGFVFFFYSFFLFPFLPFQFKFKS